MLQQQISNAQLQNLAAVQQVKVCACHAVQSFASFYVEILYQVHFHDAASTITEDKYAQNKQRATCTLELCIKECDLF